MRTIGKRREHIDLIPSAQAARDAWAHQARLLALTPEISTGIPKGVYRFKTHEKADAQRLEGLARVMATAAARAKPVRDRDAG